MRKFTLCSLFTLIGLGSILGCARNGEAPGVLTERERIVAELAISGATIRFINEDPARAEAVKTAVQAVRLAIQFDKLETAEDLQVFLQEMIPTTLNAYEQEAARAIIALVMVDLSEFVANSGVLDQETKALVLRYALAVERGAQAAMSRA